MKPTSILTLPVLSARPAQASRSQNMRTVHDPLGRGIGYLRLSLTRGCSMRCTYCRPETDANPRGELRLSPSEIEQLVRHLTEHHGLNKVRLTGGDPTSRPELLQIIERIASVPGVADLAMTTNGLTLERMAQHYRAAGLRRVNISLDTLDRDRFTRLTGVDGLDRVLRGIDAARAAGLSPIKLNTVVVRGQNESCLIELARFAAPRNLELRFIELMPMGPLASDWRERYVPASEVRERLSRAMRFDSLLPQGHDAARRHHVTLDDGRRATIGFITPMSCNFCADCNRLRITADGGIYPCLMDHPAGSLLSALRPAFDAERVDRLLRQAYTKKQPEHPAAGPVTMTAMGG